MGTSRPAGVSIPGSMIQLPPVAHEGGLGGLADLAAPRSSAPPPITFAGAQAHQVQTIQGYVFTLDACERQGADICCWIVDPGFPGAVPRRAGAVVPLQLDVRGRPAEARRCPRVAYELPRASLSASRSPKCVRAGETPNPPYI